MTTKPALDDDHAKEAFALAGGGADREPGGPALERPKRRDRMRDLTELAGPVQLRDDYDYKVLRRTRVGDG